MYKLFNYLVPGRDDEYCFSRVWYQVFKDIKVECPCNEDRIPVASKSYRFLAKCFQKYFGCAVGCGTGSVGVNFKNRWAVYQFREGTFLIK